MTDDAGNLAGAILQSALMDEARDYVQRGRRFGALADQQLNAQWVTAFRRFVQAAITARESGKPLDRQDVLDVDDAAAELRLRGLDIPVETAEPEAAALRDLVEAIGPDAPSPTLDQQIEQFLTNRQKPKN